MSGGLLTLNCTFLVFAREEKAQFSCKSLPGPKLTRVLPLPESKPWSSAWRRRRLNRHPQPLIHQRNEKWIPNTGLANTDTRGRAREMKDTRAFQRGNKDPVHVQPDEFSFIYGNNLLLSIRRAYDKHFKETFLWLPNKAHQADQIMLNFQWLCNVLGFRAGRRGLQEDVFCWFMLVAHVYFCLRSIREMYFSTCMKTNIPAYKHTFREWLNIRFHRESCVPDWLADYRLKVYSNLPFVRGCGCSFLKQTKLNVLILIFISFF